jgi:hypothetical protein
MSCGNPSVALGLALLVLASGAYMHQPPSKCPTALSRLDLLHAMAKGRINIDAYHENTPDKAACGGHFYSDKAPGTVVLAAPAFFAGAGLLKLCGVTLDSDRGWLYSSWIASVGSIGIISALGAAALFAWLVPRAGPRPALITSLALFLGAAPLPYATMMFSHSLVVGCIAVALWAMDRNGERGTKSGDREAVEIRETPATSFSNTSACSEYSAVKESGPTSEGDRGIHGIHGKVQSLTGLSPRFRGFVSQHRFDLVAGFACGWALASEYTAGIVLIGLFLRLVSDGWRRAIPFCLAAMPPLLLIPLYSWLCFGNPFVLPYSLNNSFPEMRHGLYAIKWPDVETAYNLLFSPTRGLFFWTPFLAMAAVGYWKLIETNRRLFWLTYAVPLLQIMVISGRTWDWPAGPTLGPRYLAPILPLLALPCALGVARLPRIGMLFGLYSILITTVATLTNASPPASYFNPLTQLHLSLLWKGELVPNLGLVLGLRPWAAVALFCATPAGGIAWLWRRLGRPHEASPR